MKIISITKISGNSRKKKEMGYTWMPKDKTHSGHMDTQMYPECENTRYTRDIVKKTRKNRKCKSFNLFRYVISKSKV